MTDAGYRLSRSSRGTAPRVCCSTSRRCPRRTASAMWGRRRWRGSTGSTRPGKAWWQALPLGPTGYGNSPYQPLSSFAGNALLISPDWLIEDGLLRASDCEGHSFPAHGRRLRRGRPVQASAARNGLDQLRGRGATGSASRLRAVPSRPRTLAGRLRPLPRARRHGTTGPITSTGRPSSSSAVRPPWRAPGTSWRGRSRQVRFAQFLLFRQGARLKEHARAKGVHLIGDLPFFVSPDSSDVWANPELFLLDEHHRPRVVAGVPPDYFSAEGQLWGNPDL